MSLCRQNSFCMFTVVGLGHSPSVAWRATNPPVSLMLMLTTHQPSHPSFGTFALAASTTSFSLSFNDSYFDASTSAGDTLYFSCSVSRIRTAFKSNVVLRSCSIAASSWASNSFGFQATSPRTNAKNPLGLLTGNSNSVVSIAL